jgi:hypothetical protein
VPDFTGMTEKEWVPNVKNIPLGPIGSRDLPRQQKPMKGRTLKMNKLHWTIVGAFAGGLALAVSPASAQQNVSCTGPLPPGTYGNVNVTKK